MDFLVISAMGLVLGIIGLGLYYIVKGSNGKNAKKILGMNIMSLFGILIVATVFFLSGQSTFAQTAQDATTSTSGDGLRYIAAALSTGMATIGAGIAVAVSASAALGAISEDSKLLGKTLIFVGLAEGIAIYGLIVSILILP